MGNATGVTMEGRIDVMNAALDKISVNDLGHYGQGGPLDASVTYQLPLRVVGYGGTGNTDVITGVSVGVSAGAAAGVAAAAAIARNRFTPDVTEDADIIDFMGDATAQTNALYEENAPHVNALYDAGGANAAGDAPADA